MDKAKLLEAVKALNAAVYEDDGKDAKAQLIETKIKFVAVKQVDVETAFLAACEGIPDEKQEFAPAIVGEVYQALYDEREAAEAAPEKKDKPKKEKKEKVKKEKKEGESHLPVREKDKFGNVVGSMSAAMNAILEKGAKKDAVIAAVAKQFDKEEKSLKSKFLGRIKHLEEAGHVITIKDEVYTLSLAPVKK
jgi:hypothetical protein